MEPWVDSADFKTLSWMFEGSYYFLRISIIRCDALPKGVTVHHVCSVPLRCIPLFLWWLPLSSAYDGIGVRTSCSWPIYWGLWLGISTLLYPRWTWPHVPNGWSFYAPSLRRQSSSLIHARVLYPFTIVWLIRNGFPWVHKAPLFLPHFLLSRFCLSTRSLLIDSVAW